MTESIASAIPTDGTPVAAKDTSIPATDVKEAAQNAPPIDVNSYLNNSVHDLLSLKGRTIVITGGARGLGLAFAFAVAEVGGNIAVLDALDTPHEHFHLLEPKFGVKAKLYKYVCHI